MKTCAAYDNVCEPDQAGSQAKEAVPLVLLGRLQACLRRFAQTRYLVVPIRVGLDAVVHGV
jgi:hypothetical protein